MQLITILQRQSECMLQLSRKFRLERWPKSIMQLRCQRTAQLGLFSLRLYVRRCSGWILQPATESELQYESILHTVKQHLRDVPIYINEQRRTITALQLSLYLVSFRQHMRLLQRIAQCGRYGLRTS